MAGEGMYQHIHITVWLDSLDDQAPSDIELLGRLLCVAVSALLLAFPLPSSFSKWQLPRSVRLLPAVWGLQGGVVPGTLALALGTGGIAALLREESSGDEFFREIVAFISTLYVLLVILWHFFVFLPVNYAIGLVAAVVALPGLWDASMVLNPALRIFEWLYTLERPSKWKTPPTPPKSRRKARTARAPAAAAAPAGTFPLMMPPLPVPTGAPDFVVSILMSTDHYSVLGQSQKASVEELKAAKRTLSLATHPDKARDVPGAHEACTRVLEAAELLLNTEKRVFYDREIAARRAVEAAAAAQRAQHGLDDDGFDFSFISNIAHVGCRGCAEGSHECPLVPGRHPARARYCRSCGRRHAVSHGEFWVEGVQKNGWFSSETELRLMVCIRDGVYDATEVGLCQGILRRYARSDAPINAHDNLFAMGVGGGRGGSGGSGSGGSGGGRGKKKKRGRR